MVERFPGRTVNALVKRAHCLRLKVKSRGGAGWTIEDDDTIRRLVAEGWTWAQIAGQLTGRSAGEVRTRGRTLGLRLAEARSRRRSEVRRIKGGRFTPEEDAVLRRAFDDGMSWASIAELLPGRSWESVKKHASGRLGLKTKAAATAWTEVEDAALRKAIDDGASSWADVARLLPGRTSDAAEYRGRLLGLRLRATASDRRWSVDEDAVLRQMVAEGVHSWKDIAEALPARGDLAEPRSAGAAGSRAKALRLGGPP
jgi:bacterioferritin-associated ferredoxin